MDRFNKRLFGYKIAEVDAYFDEIERQHADFIKQKKSEINNYTEKNNQLIKSINMMIEEINENNYKKTEIIDYIHKELQKIERNVEKAQQEAKEKKLAAVKRLQNRRDELLKLNEALKQCKRDLMALQYRYKLVNDQLNIDEKVLTKTTEPLKSIGDEKIYVDGLEKNFYIFNRSK